MKKFLTLLILFVMLIGGTVINHTHDEVCGYNPEKKTGCIYESNLFIDKGEWD